MVSLVLFISFDYVGKKAINTAINNTECTNIMVKIRIIRRMIMLQRWLEIY